MKKNVWIKLVAIILCIFAISNIEKVRAESCSTKELNNLKQLAHNIKLSYDLHDDTYNENHTYYFDLSVTNFRKEFYFVDSDGQEFRYMKTLEKDGIRNLRVVKEGTNYNLNVYASNETGCPDTKIVTKKIEIPYYNDYSQRKECQGIEDFSLCQRYYDGYIESEKYFLEQVEKYKKGELPDEKVKGDEGIFASIISFLSSHLLIVIPSVIVLLLVIVVIIRRIIKARKRTKIKI